MRSLDSTPRIQQPPSHLRAKGPRVWKKDRIGASLMDNEDRLYVLPKGQRNTRCFQQGMHSPILAFSGCDKVFWLVAGIVHSEKKPNRIAKQTTDAIHGEYKWDKRSVVEFR